MVINFADEKRKIVKGRHVQTMGTKTIDELKEMMTVQCIIPSSVKGTIKDEIYFIDYKSIVSNSYEVMGQCWDKDGNYVAKIILENFKTVNNPLI